jgi:hypothetical protein
MDVFRLRLDNFLRSLNPYQRAAPLEEKRVMPDTLALCNPLAAAHDAKTAALVERQAGCVLGEDGSLERPDSVGFRLSHQLGQKSSANSLPAS